MNIGRASEGSGVSAKMIRYYESIGLVPRAGRSAAGYRRYAEADVNTLRFIHRAREFGFPIERIRELVALWQDGRPSREVKKVALAHAAELDRRIAELASMRDALRDLADRCRGDHRPECPILRDLEGRSNAGAAARTAQGVAKPRAGSALTPAARPGSAGPAAPARSTPP